MDVVAKAKPDGYTLGLATISQLVFNEYLKTAKVLGRTIPQTLLQRADEVIQ